jgi:uncharacterized protein YkwD
MNSTVPSSASPGAIAVPRRRRRTARLTGSLGAFGMTAVLGIAGAGTLAPMMCGPAVTAPAPTPQQQVVDLVNQHRAAAGRAPLAVHGTLTVAAQGHADDQAQRGSMSHVGSDGSNAAVRYQRQGYPVRNWGENVAVGYATPEAVVAAWMASPSHRANIVSGAFSQIGVAVAYSANGTPYWTMALGHPW